MFAGVKESPSDDLPRLVLADWLEENGDEDDQKHAGLIRVQCEMVRRAASIIAPERPEPMHSLLRHVGFVGAMRRYWFGRLLKGDTGFATLERRETRLLKGWPTSGWSVPGLDRGSLGDWSRGFATVSHEGPFRTGEMAALAASPFGPRIEGMCLDVRPGNAAQVSRSVMLGHLSGFSSGSRCGGTEVRALLASPHLARLRGLSGFLSDGDWVKAVADAPQAARLIDLGLGYSRLKVADIRLLARAGLDSLRSLEMGCALMRGEAGADALASAPFLGRLLNLDIGSNNLGPGALAALAAGPRFRCPARLILQGNKLGAEGVRALLSAPGLEDLLVLDLAETGLDDRALVELSASPRLRGLLLLVLDRSPDIGPEGVAALAGSPNLGRLASLHLSRVAIGEDGARALARSTRLRRLQLSVDGWEPSARALGGLRERFVLWE